MTDFIQWVQSNYCESFHFLFFQRTQNGRALKLLIRALTRQPVNPQPARYFFQFRDGSGLSVRLCDHIERVTTDRRCGSKPHMSTSSFASQQLPRHQRESSALPQEWLANLGHHWTRIMHPRLSLSMAPLTGLTSFNKLVTDLFLFRSF
jgi:hypothetical protein